jgi:hypothetical protein
MAEYARIWRNTGGGYEALPDSEKWKTMMETSIRWAKNGCNQEVRPYYEKDEYSAVPEALKNCENKTLKEFLVARQNLVDIYSELKLIPAKAVSRSWATPLPV